MISDFYTTKDKIITELREIDKEDKLLEKKTLQLILRHLKGIISALESFLETSQEKD